MMALMMVLQQRMIADTSRNPLVIRRRNTLGPNRSTETRGSSAVAGEQGLCL